MEEAQTKLADKQKEEIALLKQVIKTEREDRLRESDRMKEAFLKMAFLASADCCELCCQKTTEKEA